MISQSSRGQFGKNFLKEAWHAVKAWLERSIDNLWTVTKYIRIVAKNWRSLLNGIRFMPLIDLPVFADLAIFVWCIGSFPSSSPNQFG